MKHTLTDADRIRLALRDYYDRNGLSAREGRAELERRLDVPRRTLERAEQTGHFPYPLLLLLGLEALK